MMTQKENFYAMVNGGKPEYVPNTREMYNVSRCYVLMDQPLESGLDPFGVAWIQEPEGMVTDPNAPRILEDIADWKEVVKIPDPNSLDFAAMAAQELPNFDPDKPVNIYDSVGLFERLTALMGFEDGMCAMLEDPESCEEFFSAVADYKIACYERIIDAYHPDIICYFDDICTQRGPFVSPECYRELIKPHHKRIVDAVHARGVLFMQHMCGLIEPILEDLVEIGIDIWNSAQTINDLPGIMEKYAGRLIVEGGWNNQAPCSWADSTEELLNAELKRCREVYCKHGNFILTPTIITRQGNVMVIGDRIGDSRRQYVINKWHEMWKL